MDNKITSTFTIEKGRWDAKANNFVDRMEEVKTKVLTMELLHGNNGAILKFHGGPTGYESYYVEDLVKNMIDFKGDFCICGGTINRWSRCTVPWSDVAAYLEGCGIYIPKEERKSEEQDWYFTFGSGHNPGIGYYAVFHGTFSSARDKMNAAYPKWSFQYKSAEEAGVEKYKLKRV